MDVILMASGMLRSVLCHPLRFHVALRLFLPEVKERVPMASCVAFDARGVRAGRAHHGGEGVVGGRRRSVPANVIHSELSRVFPGAQVVGEYGMSELGSQLWAVPAGSPFVPPPWMRVLAVDPNPQHHMLWTVCPVGLFAP